MSIKSKRTTSQIDWLSAVVCFMIAADNFERGWLVPAFVTFGMGVVLLAIAVKDTVPVVRADIRRIRKSIRER